MKWFGDSGVVNLYYPNGSLLKLLTEPFGSSTRGIEVADLDNDGVADFGDMKIFMGKWLSDETLLAADLNRNGVVDFVDFAFFAGNLDTYQAN